jgi:hypothetical protein
VGTRFHREFGFIEDPARMFQHLRLNLNDAGEPELLNLRTRAVYHVGRFTTPSVRELREELLALPEPSAALGKLKLSHIVANVAELIKDPENGTVRYGAARVSFACPRREVLLPACVASRRALSGRVAVQLLGDALA